LLNEVLLRSLLRQPILWAGWQLNDIAVRRGDEWVEGWFLACVGEENVLWGVGITINRPNCSFT